MKQNILNLLIIAVLLFRVFKGEPLNFSCGKTFKIMDIPTHIVNLNLQINFFLIL